MTTEDMLLNAQKTLAQRLTEGRLPAGEALRYAMHLADSLRRVHDAGRAHGAVHPSNVALVAGSLELLPAAESQGRAITPYTAPEVVQGRPADARSDIFGFGAILFEMLTGRRAFDGETRPLLAANITWTPVPTSGNPAVDRLLASCMNKNPDARCTRMQKVILELKILGVAARRAGTSPGGALRRERTGESGAALAEIQELAARAAQIERAVEEMRRHVSQFEHNMAADLVDIEQGLKVQSVAIESARTAMSQTDDLVERVVEALDSLQTSVMDRGDAVERSSFAVN